MPRPPESMLSEVKKKDLRVQNSTLILGERGWGRQGKGISISTMQKGAILRKCVKLSRVWHWWERGWGRQGKGISISTLQKGAILRKCVNTFVPHCSYQRRSLWPRDTQFTTILIVKNIPLFKTAAGQRSFQYRVVSLWNGLDRDFKF